MPRPSAAKSTRAKKPLRERGSARLKPVGIRLPEPLIDAVREFAAARRVPINAIHEAALRAYLAPGAQDQRDAMLARQLGRFNRAVEGVDWNTKLVVGMMSYLIELNLGYGPEAITDEERENVESKGARRFDRFEQWLVRHLVDPDNLHNRLQSAVTTSEKDFVENPT
jgi:hypothetical protein